MSRSAVRVRSSALTNPDRYAEYSGSEKRLGYRCGFSTSPVHHRGVGKISLEGDGS